MRCISCDDITKPSLYGRNDIPVWVYINPLCGRYRHYVYYDAVQALSSNLLELGIMNVHPDTWEGQVPYERLLTPILKEALE